MDASTCRAGGGGGGGDGDLLDVRGVTRASASESAVCERASHVRNAGCRRTAVAVAAARGWLVADLNEVVAKELGELHFLDERVCVCVYVYLVRVLLLSSR